MNDQNQGTGRTGLIKCGELPLSNLSQRERGLDCGTMNPLSTKAMQGQPAQRFKKSGTPGNNKPKRPSRRT